jgi:lysozyme
LLRRLNQGEYKAVPAELMRWVNSGGRPLPGLVRRRKAEGVLFFQGSYSVADAPTDADIPESEYAVVDPPADSDLSEV